MTHPIRLCLALHNHQPIGNFEQVFEQAYLQSYRPFLDLFEGFGDLRISLHTSGPLMEWLDQAHPEYLDRVATLVSQGRIEILGGPFYEPILTMIPARDRRGQIRLFTRWLESRLGGRVRGMWMPERVWEQSLTSDLAAAGMEYTILDDFHFRNAGLPPDALHGHYITEDEGQILSIFPGSEQLRYMIPFQDPQVTIDYLAGIAARAPGAVVVFGDDGEKFGTWPETYQHVYEHGWLRRFFDALTASRDWIQTATLGDAFDSIRPLGKTYLPEGSYREMTEWALPLDKRQALEDLKHDFHDDPRWSRVTPFVRGGYWRNFKVKYPETNEMYSRMMAVSHRLHELESEGREAEQLADARRELYRAQCNCGYWHGAFGGVYLPHLRNAVFHHLIAAESHLDHFAGRHGAWVDASAADLDFDGQKEIRLENDKLVCLLAPHHGGVMYELDCRDIRHNLLATLDRRQEYYHAAVQRGPHDGHGDVASIHDRVVFKQANLERNLQYDPWRRKALVDHFLPVQTSLQDFADGNAPELGSFVNQAFDARIRRSEHRIQVMMSADGFVEGQPIRLTKGITVGAGSPRMELAYMLEGLIPGRTYHFAMECNLAGLPAGADDRYFFLPSEQRMGQLGNRLELNDSPGLGLADDWLGIRVRLESSRATQWWAFPIQTVSQSEGGIELVHQSVAVVPHWCVQGDAEGRWSVRLELDLETAPRGNEQPRTPNAPWEEMGVATIR